MKPDAFALLGLPSDTDDDARIRAAYHHLVREGRADAAVNIAYAAIRHSAERERYRWSEPMAVVDKLPKVEDRLPDVEALVHELATLSEWEAGARE